MVKLRNKNFFSNTLTTFLTLPKNLFGSASIDTRASTGTFTLWDYVNSIKASGMRPQYRIADFIFVIEFVVIFQTLE